MANAKMSQSGPSWDAKLVFPTPLPLAEFLVVELVDRKLPEGNDSATGITLALGTAHPDTTLFSGFKLTFQREINENFVERWYARDRVETDQETYNADRHYSGDANAFPILVRNYLIPRDSYAVEAKLTPDPIVASALLVKEDLVQTNDERLTGLYVAVQKTYETLPGPWIPDHFDDLLRGPVQRFYRAVANTGQASSVSAGSTTTYKGRDGSAIVLLEITEYFSDGSGTPSGANPNAPYPVVEGPIFYDADRGNVHTHEQLVPIVFKVTGATVKAGGTGGTNGASQTVVGTTGTGTPFQALVTISGNAITAVNSISVPGTYTVRPTDISAEPVTGNGLVGAKLSLTLDATQASSLTVTTTLATLVDYDKFDEFRLKKVTTFWTLPGPVISERSRDPESAAAILKSRQMKKFSAITSLQSVDTGTLIIVEAERSRYGFDLAFEVITAISAADAHDLASAIEEEEVRPYQFPGIIDESIVDAAGTAIAYRRAVSETVSHKILTWWVNSLTKPTISVDEISPDDIVINNVPYRSVLHDAFDRFYNGTEYHIPATTPSYSTYVDSWVGTEKTISGSVTNERYLFHWKCTQISVVMKGGVVPTPV